MKVYLCLLIHKDSISELDNYELLNEWKNRHGGELSQPIIYGFTKDKKLFKDFMSLRNKNKFKTMTVDMTDIQYSNFEAVHRALSMITKSEVLYAEDSYTKLPITMGEFWYCVENIKETSFYIVEKIREPIKNIPINIFTDETRRFLEDMGFLDYLPFTEDRETELAGIISKGAWRNQFGLLMYLYSSLFEVNKVLARIGGGNDD